MARSLLEIMWEGGYDPKGGRPVPIEKIYRSNTVSRKEYLAEIERQRRVRQAGANAAAISKEEADAEELNQRAIRAGVPRRFLGYPLDLTKIDDLNAGRGVYIFGNQGTHKTTIGCSMLRGWLKEHPFGVARFVRSTTLLDAFRDTFNTRDSILGIMSEHAYVDLLLLDDLGKEVADGRAVSRLWELIDRRYGDKRPTIITSQYDPDALATHFGQNGGAESALAIMRRVSEEYSILCTD